MTEEEVLNVLKGKELTSKELQEIINIGRASICRALKQLIKSQEVSRKFYFTDGSNRYTIKYSIKELNLKTKKKKKIKEKIKNK